ncbi:unnamed protein product [Schistosoma mattheei]|uniref:Uncharacterized protein n=1 Tax=Schistosoma mattheei TaxID=31246 RepID=A0A183Q7H1_9TREM|nr:unnamed protein product [Schistosoma mattheei]
MRRRKSPSPDDLPLAPSKDGGDFLTKELTTLFTKVWELESVQRYGMSRQLSLSLKRVHVVPVTTNGGMGTSDCVQAIGIHDTSQVVQNLRMIDS